ncbi:MULTISPECIES: hypothetical protein [unclassified Myroides]|uniref:hypothetical protein n=1 Tax=unclassified Myroides TaxID=2642485 RepID=UPI00257898CE|nr:MULTISPECIES: hypothetical protein [unclassified Myroides]
MLEYIKKIILIVLTFSCLFSCKKSKEYKASSIEQVDYGTLYFVRFQVNTDRAVSCNNFMNELGFITSYFKIQKQSFIDELLSNPMIEGESGDDYGMDVRYRIELKDKIICIDNFGNYSIDNKYRGTLSNFQLLLNYVEMNRENSIKLEEDFSLIND